MLGQGRGALAEALADVGAARFLAHRVQAVLAQDALDLLEALAVAEAHANPVGLRQRATQYHSPTRMSTTPPLTMT